MLRSGIVRLWTLRCEIATERLLAVGNEAMALNGLAEFRSGHPAEPGHLSGIWIDSAGDDGFVDPEPVRAEFAMAEELEHEADRDVDAQLLCEFACSRCMVGLPDVDRSAEGRFIVAGKSGQPLGTPVYQEPTILVPANAGRDAMQPTVTHGGAPVDDAEHTVLVVHMLHKFSHSAHDRRTFVGGQPTRAGRSRAARRTLFRARVWRSSLVRAGLLGNVDRMGPLHVAGSLDRLRGHQVVSEVHHSAGSGLARGENGAGRAALPRPAALVRDRAGVAGASRSTMSRR